LLHSYPLLQTFRRNNLLVVYLLLAIFLLQPILTYLVTPHFQRDSQGILVEICTLEGQRQVVLQLDEVDQSADIISNERCGAIELFKFSSIFYTPEIEFSPKLQLFAVHAFVVQDVIVDSQWFEHVYSARAPPVIS